MVTGRFDGQRLAPFVPQQEAQALRGGGSHVCVQLCGTIAGRGGVGECTARPPCPPCFSPCVASTTLCRWGYTHVGQILEVDSANLLGKQVADGSVVTATSPHNLEVSWGQDSVLQALQA